MNHRIESMKPSASMVLMARAKQMQKTDPTVIGLAGGEPDFATPDRISMAAIRSLSEGYTHYVVGPGLPELRAAIAKKLREENGLEYDENCILVTPGGKNAIYLAVQAILNEGDEVLVLDPAWVSYEPIVQAAGGVTVKVKLDYQQDYRITAVGSHALQALLELGHLTLVFDSASAPRHQGTVHLAGKVPALAVLQGDVIVKESAQ